MAGARATPRVFSVPAGVPFLPTLADALLSGDLVPLPAGDPLALAGVTVLLPTRRAVRAFADAMIARLGGDAAILPTIRPIGDVDEDDQLLDANIEATGDRLLLPPAISPLTRRLTLTRLTLAWAKTFRRGMLELGDDDPLLIPASAADATRLAGDLARLLDDVETAGVPWDALATLVPDDHAEYFRLTLRFLNIITEQWPAHLAERGLADPAERRDSLIRAAASRLAEHGSPGPVVAAGSTGSIPATAALLKAVAHLANGAVVLPGLDQTLDAAGWEAIGGGDRPAAAAFGHPQFGLKHLIGEIGIAREDVAPLGTAPAATAPRARLLSEAVRPAGTTEAWAGITAVPDALAGVDLLVARSEQEEATAIALAIREQMEIPGTTAALVTPDRTLARRVAAELGRWGLAIDDSAGAPLDREPQGMFARHVAEAAASAGDPIRLLALLKHPFAAFGMAREECRRAARILEVALFRGRRGGGGIAGLPAALEKAKADLAVDDHAPAVCRRLGARDWALAVRLAANLGAALGPLEAAVAADGEVSAAALAALLAAALASAATDDTGSDGALWQGQGGAALATLVEGLAADSEAAALLLRPADFSFFLGALLADVRVQRQAGADSRIHIWGTLEARLQSVDLLVLGGLDEGLWPAAARTDPWLSRAMRSALGLPPPERRLGLAAHDFFAGLAAPRVIVTRAEKRGGAPTVESRWLQRLRALVGEDEAKALAARGQRYVAFARALDNVVKSDVAPVRRPEPRPPVEARPKSLPITDIETLIRDPYAIYAKRILRLQKLEPIGRPPDGGLRGTLIHRALGQFTQGWNAPHDAAAEASLNEIGAKVLEEIADFPDVLAVWSVRMRAIAAWLIAFEAERDPRVAARHAEIRGAMEVIPGVFTLTGVADRVDEMKDGTLAIYDFKTATPQTDRTVFAGLTPQMTLEAAMARAGGFPGIAAGASVSELAWLALGKIGRDEPYMPVITARQNTTPDASADAARAHLVALAAAFASAGHPYTSRTRPRMESTRYIGDYDHLARVREWALVESPEDVAGMSGPAP